MKKILIFIIMLIIVIFNCAYIKKDFSLRDYFPEGQITIYSNIADCDNQQIVQDVYITHNRNSVIGESVFLKNFETDQILKILGAKVMSVEYVDELTILFCRTDKISKLVEHSDQKINLQIASCEEYTVVGWPMILGAF